MLDLNSLPTEPLSVTIQKRAWAQGYTELRFNPATMGWAWHKPDQAVTPDGRVFVRHSPPA